MQSSTKESDAVLKLQACNLIKKKTPTWGFIYLVRTQTFRKTKISYPLVRTRACAYQGVRNVTFSEHFAYVLNE